jgi:hypothetical protein
MKYLFPALVVAYVVLVFVVWPVATKLAELSTVLGV